MINFNDFGSVRKVVHPWSIPSGGLQPEDYQTFYLLKVYFTVRF